MLSLLTGYHSDPIHSLLIRPEGWATWAIAAPRVIHRTSADGEFRYVHVPEALFSHALYCHLLRGGAFSSVFRACRVAGSPELSQLIVLGGSTKPFWDPVPGGSFTFGVFDPTEDVSLELRAKAFAALSSVYFSENI